MNVLNIHITVTAGHARADYSLGRKGEDMLLKDIIEKSHYAFHDRADSWEDAIRLSCGPLEKDGTVDQTYADEIIACVRKHGPYIVIVPGLAMPHSTENAVGVHGTDIGFMKLAEPISFEEGNPAKDASVFFTLASIDSDAHLENMQRLYTVLTNEEVLAELQNVKGPEDLIRLDAICEAAQA